MQALIHCTCVCVCVCVCVRVQNVMTLWWLVLFFVLKRYYYIYVSSFLIVPSVKFIIGLSVGGSVALSLLLLVFVVVVISAWHICRVKDTDLVPLIQVFVSPLPQGGELGLPSLLIWLYCLCLYVRSCAWNGFFCGVHYTNNIITTFPSPHPY